MSSLFPEIRGSCCRTGSGCWDRTTRRPSLPETISPTGLNRGVIQRKVCAYSKNCCQPRSGCWAKTIQTHSPPDTISPIILRYLGIRGKVCGYSRNYCQTVSECWARRTRRLSKKREPACRLHKHWAMVSSTRNKNGHLFAGWEEVRNRYGVAIYPLP